MLKARSENRKKGEGVYYEAHHIIPKCLGGLGRERHWKTHPNIILLTAKEHYLAHKLLWFIYPKNYKLWDAFWSISTMGRKGQERHKISMRIFENLRTEHAKRNSGDNSPSRRPGVAKKISKSLTGLLIGKKNPFYGKKHNKSSLSILSEKAKLRLSEKEKNPMFGKTHKKESIEKNINSQPNKNEAFLFDMKTKKWIFENASTNEIGRYIDRISGKHSFVKGINFDENGFFVFGDRYYYCENNKHEIDDIKKNVPLKWKSNQKICAQNTNGDILYFDTLWDGAGFISKLTGKNIPSFYFGNLSKHLDLPNNKKRGWSGYKFNFVK